MQARNIIAALSEPLKPRATGEATQIHPLPDIKAVLLDVYGTLLISASGDISLAKASSEEASCSDALAAVGLDASRGAAGEQAFFDQIEHEHARLASEGEDWPEVDVRETWCAALSQVGLGDFAAEDELIARLTLEYELRVNRTWPMPGARELLATLRTNRLRMGIVSNAQWFTPVLIEHYLEASMGELGFEPGLCIYSFRMRSAKPSRGLFRPALDRLAADGIEPEQALYVGNDIRNDVWPASESGMRTALFAGDERSLRWRRNEPECLDVVPDLVITDLRQLPEAIL